MKQLEAETETSLLIGHWIAKEECCTGMKATRQEMTRKAMTFVHELRVVLSNRD
jgi:hypothetical protein